MNAAEFVVGVGVGVIGSSISTIVWNLGKYSLPLWVLGSYPNLKGSWTSSYTYGEQKRVRHIRVECQCWQYISGTFTGENPDQHDDIRTYKFRGRLISDDIVLGEFWIARSISPDRGAFMLKFDHHARTAEGGIVSLDYDKMTILAINSYKATHGS